MGRRSETRSQAATHRRLRSVVDSAPVLGALEDALEKRLPCSDSALCRNLKMSRQTLWEWRHDLAFTRWLQSELDRTSDENWHKILRRHEYQAIQGSVRSAEFIAKVRFLARQTDDGVAVTGGGDPTTNYSIHFSCRVRRHCRRPREG